CDKRQTRVVHPHVNLAAFLRDLIHQTHTLFRHAHVQWRELRGDSFLTQCFGGALPALADDFGDDNMRARLPKTARHRQAKSAPRTRNHDGLAAKIWFSHWLAPRGSPRRQTWPPRAPNRRLRANSFP